MPYLDSSGDIVDTYTPMVPHHAGRCHRTSGIMGIHHDTHHSGQVLQSGTFCSTYQTPVSHGARTTISRPCASATRSEQLPWVEYAINSQTRAATGLSPFEASVGYQPSLFPQQEVEVTVPSVQQHYRRCRRTWKAAGEVLHRTEERNVRYTNATAVRPRTIRSGREFGY